MSHVPALMPPGSEDATPVIFYHWRKKRLACAAMISAMAAEEAPADAEALADVARLIYRERLDQGSLNLLRQHLERRLEETVNLRTVDDLQECLTRALARFGKTVSLPHFPTIRPDWSKTTPLNLVGTIDGVPVNALLDEGPTPARPEYRVIFQTENGDFTTDPLSQGGVHLQQAGPAWDWLFAQKLALLAAGGFLVPNPFDDPLSW